MKLKRLEAVVWVLVSNMLERVSFYYNPNLTNKMALEIFCLKVNVGLIEVAKNFDWVGLVNFKRHWLAIWAE